MSPEQLAATLQAARDSAKSRKLTDESVDRSRGATEFAMGEWDKGEGQREGYRTGAMNFGSRQNPFAINAATGMGFGPPGGGGGDVSRAAAGAEGYFDPNAKFMASMGMQPGPQTGFAPSNGMGGTGGYTPPNPTTQPGGGVFGSVQDAFGMLPGMGGGGGGGGSMGTMANEVMRRFGSQERGSGTDFITPSRRSSSIKRAV